MRCTIRSCRATIKTPLSVLIVNENTVFTEHGEHDHEPRPNKTRGNMLRDQMIVEALSTDNTARNIIHRALTGYSQDVISATGSYDSLVQVVNRTRKSLLDPGSVVEPVLNIEEALMFTMGGARFYQYGPNNARDIVERSNIIIFFSEDMIDTLKNSRIWSIDGTFAVCPDNWYQLYTISILLDNHVLPVVFALLPSKSLNTYNLFLYYLNQLISELNPHVIMSDFETAAIT
ncbi:hypothetical protein CDIK_4194, partial [Cucumispora dikerogammari]